MGVTYELIDAPYPCLCAVYRCECGATEAQYGADAAELPPAWAQQDQGGDEEPRVICPECLARKE